MRYYNNEHEHQQIQLQSHSNASHQLNLPVYIAIIHSRTFTKHIQRFTCSCLIYECQNMKQYWINIKCKHQKSLKISIWQHYNSAAVIASLPIAIQNKMDCIINGIQTLAFYFYAHNFSVNIFSAVVYHANRNDYVNKSGCKWEFKKITQ